MAACETPRIQMFYVPALAPAPEWCSFLDNLTDELEEDRSQVIYDDYTFVTREELDKLGSTKMLKGTEYLRPYMHGFFMDTRLYNKLKSLADPFAYAKYRADRIKSIRSDRAASRITDKSNKVTQPKKEQPGEDDRFLALTDPEFATDTNDPSFKRIRASRPANFDKVLARMQSNPGGQQQPATTNKKNKKQPKNKKQKVKHEEGDNDTLSQMVEFQDGGRVGWGGAISDTDLKEQQWRTQASLGARLETLAENGNGGADDSESKEPVMMRSRTGGMSLTYTPADRPGRKRKGEMDRPSAVVDDDGNDRANNVSAGRGRGGSGRGGRAGKGGSRDSSRRAAEKLFPKQQIGRRPGGGRGH
eukprot:TRINITY_DN1907_c1_g1_i4.p1 TRINITY_DN1907_c1_g1~~TRINITY_DN1907_c1_g1_i4.p1  ORF type:complete len:360 (-),score=75.13 TRINITY_DN1907_c1_g1_i4:56-1135(-)